MSYGMDAAGSLTSDGLRTFENDASGRLVKTIARRDGEAASILYRHNALGQRVFKSDPQVEDTLPDEERLGKGFIAWLKGNFGWLFARTKGAMTGTAFVYDEAGNLLAEAEQGRATTRATDYIWLPLEGGGHMLMGLYKDGQFYAVHTDHLGTPRLATDAKNRPVWQWAYSAFGANQPIGMLQVVASQDGARLRGTAPLIELNLRFPGQYFDAESNLSYNYFRQYDPRTGRYTQYDPIGHRGGWNPFAYVGNSPLLLTDPNGLQAAAGATYGGRIGAGVGSAFGPIGAGIGAGVGVGVGAGLGWLLTRPLWSESSGPSNPPPIPTTPDGSPGEGWEWKGSGSPESGKGNWVNPETGQKLHPDLKHPQPKGPHWGLTNPDGSKWDYFPGKGSWERCPK